MFGKQLATTEEVIVLVSPDSDEELVELNKWAEARGIAVTEVPVGESIETVYDETTAYLGVTLGGDGTYLEGVREFSPKGIPLLGVNAGHLAFLASVSPNDLTSALDEVINGQTSVEERQQLQARTDGVDTTGINDIMIEPVAPENPYDRKITDLQVFVDDEYVGQYQGSGIAVSTPTGSTGVSLSADGPVHFPKNNSSLQIVPLHTHRLGVRPLVVNAESTIKIITLDEGSLLVDGGRAHTRLSEEDVVTVTGSDTPALIVNTSYDDDFLTSISEKLGWSIREDRNDTGHIELIREVSESEDIIHQARFVAQDAARAAGKVLQELHGKTEEIKFKSDKADIVTEADHKADNVITASIASEFPDHGIRSEESDEVEADSEYAWLIDPLDGTGNFAHANPNYSVSIALLKNEKTVMGVVYAPETEDMFTAIEGEGAHRNGRPISTSETKQLDESMLLSGYDPNGDFLSHCYQETRGVRCLGSAALNLCYLASGAADGVWEYDTYPWDTAAGAVIAREAGATIMTANGNEYNANSEEEERNELIASNGHIHDALLEHLQREPKLNLQPQVTND